MANNFINLAMDTIALVLSYDGTAYAGWQVQSNALAVQTILEKAFSDATGAAVKIIGCGRTDAGVHARKYVASIKVGNSSIRVPQAKLHLAINRFLPKDIRVLKSLYMDEDFNARFDAVSREYSYSVSTCEDIFDNRFTSYYRFPINEELLFEVADIFTGRHNFTTFSKLNRDTKNYECNVYSCFWEKLNVSKYRMHIKADRFVYGMVRSIAGAMLECARGRRSIDELSHSLSLCDRKLGSPMAEAKGLVLEKISYPMRIESILFDDIYRFPC